MPDWQYPRGDAIRVHIDRSQPLPDPSNYFHPPCFDADSNPIYFGSASFGDVVQPCKVTRKVDELVCVVPYRLVERTHRGPFTVLPFTDAMDLVPTSHGLIPEGYRPVVGGVDESGRLLYHAVAWVRGERVPGRTSEHLVRFWMQPLQRIGPHDVVLCAIGCCRGHVGW